MARIKDERFEANPGYDTTWSLGETVGSGSVVDEDADTADVGSPSLWESQCLKLVTTGNDAKVTHDFGADKDKFYYRQALIITAESLGDGQRNRIHRGRKSTAGGFWTLLDVIQESGGDLKFQMWFKHDGTTFYSFNSNVIDLNTEYIVEYGWNKTAGTYGWRQDGTVLNSGSLTGDAATAGLGRFELGFNGAETDAAMTIYTDRVVVDDANWVMQVKPVGLATETETALSIAKGQDLNITRLRQFPPQGILQR